MNQQLTTFLKELKQYGIKENIPNVTETVGKFLNIMIKIKEPKNILEIGCANGYSTIWMAEAAKKIKSKITTIDFSEPTFKEAQKNIQEVGFNKIVDFHLGNALKIIPSFKDKKFDFIFIDGQKRSYLDFWNLIQNKMTSDAIVIFDDILAFHKKTESLVKHLKKEINFEQVVLPIDEVDGILMLIRK